MLATDASSPLRSFGDNNLINPVRMISAQIISGTFANHHLPVPTSPVGRRSSLEKTNAATASAVKCQRYEVMVMVLAPTTVRHRAGRLVSSELTHGAAAIANEQMPSP